MAEPIFERTSRRAHLTLIEGEEQTGWRRWSHEVERISNPSATAAERRIGVCPLDRI